MVICMNEIFFLFFAFLTVFLSIKLSYYADIFSKTSGVSKALVGGIVLAGVTSLPEFVTCFSAVLIDNPGLAIGDILGSNLFNVFMVCFFDILFLRKMMFINTARSHNFVLFLLLVNYCVLFLFITSIFNFTFLSLSFPSLVIFVSYLFYFKKITGFDEKKEVKQVDNFIVLKIVITSILMVFSSVLLTIIVNNLSLLYPSFSSSFLGAILLGVTTSLPEVVTFYTLFVIGNYDLALSNIFGSNLFNLLVLAICDVLVLGLPIYSFSDYDTVFLIIFGFVCSLLCMFSNFRIKTRGFLSYSFFSFLVVIIYIGFWVIRFFFS